MSQRENINLFYTEGSSDKTYQAQLEEKGGGWVVNFQYGRRGSALKSGTKTASPLDFDKAKAEYDKLVRSKMKDGYTPDVSGSVYQNTDAGQEFTGIAPQLLTDLREPGDIELLMLDRGWGAQEKYDGERRMIRIQDGEVSGINRNGMRVALPMTLVEEAKSLKMANGLIDGEIIGEKYYAFDLLERDGTDLRTKSVLARHQALGEVLAVGKLSGIRGVEMAFTVEAKRALVSKVQGVRGEGIVFKQLTAPYVPGRPASGGNQRKWKFTASATVRVGSIHATKRSVGLECDDESGKAVKLGNCMVPANHQLPKVGDLVEVTYLYLYRGGSLFQPQYGGKRADKTDADTLGSFKLKADNATDDDDATVATESAVAAEAPVKKAKAPKA